MTSRQSAIFRENALKELNNIESLPASLKVVEGKSVAYLLAALFTLLAIMLWVVLGQIEMEVMAQGIVLPIDSMLEAEKAYQNYHNEQKSSLSTLQYLLEKKQELYKKHIITIEELERAKQSYLNAQANDVNFPAIKALHNSNLFVSNASKNNYEMGALLFVNHAQGKKIAAGMLVYLLPTILSYYEYGYIKGKVTEVSEYPVSKESIYMYLGNRNLVDEYFAGGAPFVVKIKLDKDQHTASGLSWTTKQGAPFNIEAGTTVMAKIVHHHYHPYELLSI